MAVKSQKGRLITASEAACENIRRFSAELTRNPALAEIMAYGRAWYACKSPRGGWAIGPSKFIGYDRNTAEDYLRTHRARDGRLTEQALRQWFVEIGKDDPLYAELLAAIREVFAEHGKAPNKLLRVYAMESDTGSVSRRRPMRAASQPSDRITVNPNVCGGRPCIRNMRIRVSDILELMASGVERAEILADYPYLEAEDIDAVLEYAAQLADHRVIRAA